MSWIGKLCMTIAGGAAIAGPMYAICEVAERNLQDIWLRKIRWVISDQRRLRSARPSEFLQEVFSKSFDKRQASRKCILRSISATLVMFLTFSLFCSAAVYKYITDLSGCKDILVALVFIAISFPADFVALWKTRVLLKSPKLSGIGTICLVDLALSFLISIGFLVVVQAINLLLSGYSIVSLMNAEWYTIYLALFSPFYLVPGLEKWAGGFWWYDIACASTFFTSIWTILIFLSVSTIRLAMPLQRYTKKFLKVREHPMRAVGAVAALLVMAVSVAVGLFRAII